MGGMDKKRLIRELQDLRHDIKEDAERKLIAVDLLINHLNQSDDEGVQESLLSGLGFSGKPQPSTTSAHPQSVSTPRAYGNGDYSSSDRQAEKIRLTQEVRKAVREIEGTFNKQDIIARLTAKYPRADINPTGVTNALARMVKRGEGIELVEEGYGSEPNTYRVLPDHDLGREGPANDGSTWSEEDDEEDSMRD